jgi:four helix bundle protein
MNKNILKEKSFQFALNIVKLFKYLSTEKKEYILSKQLLRSGTAIGALVCESEFAESKVDFVHKLKIALKEANETNYWIELLYLSEYIQEDYQTYIQELSQIIKILISSINTANKSISKQGIR